MKKVAGTLRIDLAQYRELEAFSKFGSDLDPVTQRQLTRGERLVEILKQGQYEPVPVEEQVAIILITTGGLLDSVPIARVKEFEKEFIERMTLRHGDAMRSIRTTGVASDEVVELLTKEAKDLAALYTETEKEEV